MEWELGVSRCKLLYVEYMKNQVLLYIAQETIFNIQCVCLVVQLCLTLCDPMACSPPGSSVHGISQARILEWVVISSSRGSSQPRDLTHSSCGFFTTEAPGKCLMIIFLY